MNTLLASILLATLTAWSALSFAANMGADAVDSEFANQDAQVERHKLMLAGYYEDSGFDAELDDVEYEASDKAKVAAHANAVIAKAYGRRS